MSQRITVRLKDGLYDRLVLFAQGRSQGQTPDISAIVREALEQYLVPMMGQYKRDSSRHSGRQKSEKEQL